MTATTLRERLAGPRAGSARRAADGPLAYLVTALLIAGAFAWPFLLHPDRAAPTRDPAYYAWRTEALLSEDPATFLEIRGPLGMFDSGYRVTVTVLAALLRRIGGVEVIRPTVLLMVAVPVVTSLLLAAFARRHLRDPIAWHATAFASAALMLAPPFLGYLDNMLCLTFLAASLLVLDRARDSRAARAAFGGFLVLAGLTHATTLAVFFLTLCAMAGARLLWRRFDLRSTWRDDGPMLLTALAAVAVTLVIWQVGIWGRAASLSEAAQTQPYPASFFMERLLSWIAAMRPWLTVPLLVAGAAGLAAFGRRWVENEMARLSIVWMAPLLGVLGFALGLRYTYYRFFNTTLAWVLLVGAGAFFLVRLLMASAARGGAFRLGWSGVLAVAAALLGTYLGLLQSSGWADPDVQWLTPGERAELETLRSALHSETHPDRPVIFVMDDVPPRPYQIWAFVKLSTNVARYGVPHGQIDRAYAYLGSLDDYMEGRPTRKGQTVYDMLSPAVFDYAEDHVAAADGGPVIVLARMFNTAGENAGLFEGGALAEPAPDEELWVVDDGVVRHTRAGADVVAGAGEDADGGLMHAVWAVVAVALLLLPGLLVLRAVLPDAGVADAGGLVPVLSAGMLAGVGVLVLAALRAPLGTATAWAVVLACLVLGAAARGGRAMSQKR